MVFFFFWVVARRKERSLGTEEERGRETRKGSAAGEEDDEEGEAATAVGKMGAKKFRFPLCPPKRRSPRIRAGVEVRAGLLQNRAALLKAERVGHAMHRSQAATVGIPGLVEGRMEVVVQVDSSSGRR